jgi:hypothetical protein
MSQSKAFSFIEACTNVVLGYGIACAAQAVIFPWFGIYVSTSQHLQIGALFTVVSLVRGYVIRRLFERFTFL